MTFEEAAEFIADPRLDGRVWADLGCGDGTFTLALATLLPRGSVVHAMDRDRRALAHIPNTHDGRSIVTHVGDFTAPPWPFDRLDGLLLANSLHYVRDQAAFIRNCAAAMHRRRFLIVEYDTDVANPWVPFPLSRECLTGLFSAAGYRSIDILRTRPSIYQRAPMYAALIDAGTD